MLNKIVVLNLSLLITHQVDAAYWHEWEMFLIPGGIQFFDIFNLVVFIILLACFISVIQRKNSGVVSSLIIAAVSGIVLPIHSGFALAGFNEFSLPVSIAAIVGTFIASVWQIVLTLRSKHEFNAARQIVG